MKLHKELQATAHYCPSCARQLAVDVHERKRPVPDDVVLDLETVDRSSAG